MDDAVEVDKLLSLNNEGKKRVGLNLFSDDSLFKRLSQDSIVHIGNGFKQIYTDSNFAFAFVWSGEGLGRIIKNNSELRYFINPSISYISSDLLAQVKDNSGAYCVSRYLSSARVLKIVENNNFYFSPYANIGAIDDASFHKAYAEFLKLLPTLMWVDSLKFNYFESINKSWERVKLDFIVNDYNYVD